MEIVSINGQARENTGKTASRAARRDGRIPAVLYGANDTLVHFTLTLPEVKPLIYTPDFKLAEINLDGNSYRCIVKEVIFHPVTDDIQHIDFLALTEGRTIKVEVPVRFRGTAPGVRAGGKLQQAVRRVKIKTTPDNLIDAMYVNISKLELGQSIRVRDIDPAEGIEILNSPGIPLASIEIPRALRSATAAAEKAAAGK